jgi:membrane fusion protein (multidrug efflux system)
VEVELPQAVAEGAYLVPQNAVMRDTTGAAHAWVVEEGKVAVRNLTVLTASENRWVITGGLKEGDEIITSGFQKIGPGAPVEIVREKIEAAVQPAKGN